MADIIAHPEQYSGLALGRLLATAAPTASTTATLAAQIEGLRAQLRALGATPSYAVGSPFIGSDQMANIHYGEMIIDRRSADVLRDI